MTKEKLPAEYWSSRYWFIRTGFPCGCMFFILLLSAAGYFCLSDKYKEYYNQYGRGLPSEVTRELNKDERWTQIGYGTSSLGGFLLLVGVVPWFVRFMKRATDEKMSNWLVEDIEMAKRRAREEMNVAEEEIVREPIVLLAVASGRISGIPSDEQNLQRQGKDKVYRFTPVHLIIFNFTADYVCCFQAHLSALRRSLVSEKTDEYFYKDVVKVSTERSSGTHGMYGRSVSWCVDFELAVSSGDKIHASVPDPAVVLHWGREVATPADEAVKNIRAMIRSKKMGASD